MIFPISDLGAIGVVKDVPAHTLPLNAWTSAQNVRMTDQGVEKIQGDAQLFASVSYGTLFWGMSMLSYESTPKHWLITGDNANFVASDGSTTVNRADTISADARVSGVPFNGFGVVTNSNGGPGYFNPLTSTWSNLIYSGANTWIALNYRCKVIRAFKNFLVALAVTKAPGTFNPVLVKWSSPADPGALPTTWDETDATNTAGEVPLAESAGHLMDCLPLRDVNIVYKEDAVWAMQFVGGAFVFRFYKLFDSFGLLNTGCVAATGDGRHAFLSQDDVIVTDGQNAKSMLNRRCKRELMATWDMQKQKRAFVMSVPDSKEIWICYPEIGQSFPSRAIVWSWESNTISFRSLSSAGFGAELLYGGYAATTDLWSGDSAVWSSDTTPWDSNQYYAGKKAFILGAVDGKARVVNFTEENIGTAMTSSVERTDIGVPFHANASPDITSMKLIRNVWPKIVGTVGATVNVYVGTQMKAGGTVTWGAAKPFVIGTTEKIDVLASGRLFAVKFENTDSKPWRLHGYDLDVVRAGAH